MISLLEEWHKNCPPIVPHDCFPPWLVAAEIGPASGEASSPFPAACRWVCSEITHWSANSTAIARSLPIAPRAASGKSGWKENPSIRTWGPSSARIPLSASSHAPKPSCHRPRPIPSPALNEKASQIMESERMLHSTCSAPLLSCEKHSRRWPHLHLPTDFFVMPITSCL